MVTARSSGYRTRLTGLPGSRLYILQLVKNFTGVQRTETWGRRCE